MSFVHLHTHTCFSLMRGIPFPEELVQAARDHGQKTLAVTDRDGLYGLLWFLEAAKHSGIKPIVGAELTGNGRAVVLAKNWEGYRSLCRLITARHMEEHFSLPRALAEQNGDLFVLSNDERVLRALAGRENTFIELLPERPNFRLLKMASELSLRPVATAGVHYTDPQQHALHHLLRAIDENTTLKDVAPSTLAPPSWTLVDESQMRQTFSYCPEAVENAARIASQCRTDWAFSQVIFPSFEGRDADASFELLREKCMTGIRRRYGRPTPQIIERLEYELDIVRQKHFVDIFLIIEDIISQTSLTCGRGSAAASIISYLLGITHVEPLEHNLFFERFLNPDRVDPPDIDVDFAWDERDDILDYIFKRYGGRQTAMIANHVCFRARASLREIAKVYGLPEGEIASVTKRMRGLWYEFRGSTTKMIQKHPMFRKVPLEEPWPEIIQMASMLEGRPRNLSVHCGGVVIVPQDIRNHAPCQLAPKGVPIIQWEKDQAEDAGLVKVDILGNRSLAVIRDTLASIREHYGINIPYGSLSPLNDPDTQKLLARGDTMGVFYVESPAMRQLQKKTGKGDFEHLVIHSSIIRPAANHFINEYVARLKGAPYKPLHPVLGKLFAETYGIMVYQEDVSRTAMALAGFNAAQADGLRKILTKKSKRRLNEHKQKFYHGANKKGLDSSTIDAVWDMIMSFSGYSFCKPHSASYALVSFKSAWLKAHYPAQFIAAVISNQGGFYAPFAYVSEAKRMGLRVLGPDINRSEKQYTGRNGWLQIGLMQLSGLNCNCTEELLENRRANGPFDSFDDFIRRVRPAPSDTKTLIKAGCFDRTEPEATRPELIWSLYRKGHAARLPKGKTGDLFAQETKVTTPPRPPQYDRKTIFRHEAEILGFLASCHPLALYSHELSKIRHVKGVSLHKHVGRRVTTVGWYVTGKVVSTKNRQSMEFVSFEDTTAIYETVFFPQAYRRFCQILSQSRPYVLSGKVEESFGAVSLNVDKVRLL